jgi:hypothetical protein
MFHISDFKGMYIKQIESVGLDFQIIALFFFSFSLSLVHSIRLPLLGNSSASLYISRGGAKLQNAAVASPPASKLNVFAFPARCTEFAVHKRALSLSDVQICGTMALARACY